MEKIDFLGMTVNERLYVSGLIDSFYKAIRKRDTQKVIEILKKIEIGDDNIPPILKQNGLSDERNTSE